MGVTDKIWGALTSMIKLEDKVHRQSDAMKLQQQKIEDLTSRVIRLEAQLELLTAAAMIKKLKGDYALFCLPPIVQMSWSLSAETG